MTATWSPEQRIVQAAKHRDALRRADRIADLIRTHKTSHVGCSKLGDCQGIGDGAAREITLMQPHEVKPVLAAALEQLAERDRAQRTLGRAA